MRKKKRKRGCRINISSILFFTLFFSINWHIVSCVWAYDIAKPDNYIILTDTNPDCTVDSDNVTHLFGSSSINHVTIKKGAWAKFINFPNSNIITIESDSTLFSVSRSGATVTIRSNNLESYSEKSYETLIVIPATKTNQTILFTEDNNSLDLVINADSHVMLGSTVVEKTEQPVTPPELVPPNFEGIVQLIPLNSTTLSIAWLEASDNITSADMLEYQIHISESENFEPDADTLKQSITGELQSQINALGSGKNYYVLITVSDEDGNISRARDYCFITMPSKDMVLSSATKLNIAEELNLGVPVINNNTYTFTKSQNSILPTDIAILIGNDGNADAYGNEGGYLRKVVSVSETSDKIIVETTDGSLSEAVEQGSLRSLNVAFDLDESGDPKASLHSSKSSISHSRHFTDSSGSQISQAAWKNRLLSADQIKYCYDDGEIAVTPMNDRTIQISPSKNKSSRDKDFKKIDAEVTQEVTWGLDAEFEPQLVSYAEWGDGIMPDKAEVTAKGSLNLTALVEYHFSAAATYYPEPKLILEKTYRSTYVVGTVPVYQEITLSLKAGVEAKAQASINATAEGKASTTVQIGVKYENGDWKPVYGAEFAKEVTVNLNAQGKVTGSVRLIPEIKITFYKAAYGSLSVQPYIRSEISNEAVANANLLTGHGYGLSQPTAFDVALGIECFASAGLDAIIKDIKLLDNVMVCGAEPEGFALNIPEIMLFSLPKIDLNVEAGQDGQTEINLKAAIENGANNSFNKDSLKWEIIPEVEVENQKIELVQEGKYSATATFCPPETGEYTIFVSGYGILGEAARKFAVQTIDVSNACMLTAEFTATPEWGAMTLQVSADASASKDPAGLPLTYQWHTSDGQTAEGVNPEFTFNNSGAYTISLTVRNSAGKSAAFEKVIQVADSCYYSQGGYGYEETNDGTGYYEYCSRESDESSWINWVYYHIDGTPHFQETLKVDNGVNEDVYRCFRKYGCNKISTPYNYRYTYDNRSYVYMRYKYMIGMQLGFRATFDSLENWVDAAWGTNFNPVPTASFKSGDYGYFCSKGGVNTNYISHWQVTHYLDYGSETAASCGVEWNQYNSPIYIEQGCTCGDSIPESPMQPDMTMPPPADRSRWRASGIDWQD